MVGAAVYILVRPPSPILRLVLSATRRIFAKGALVGYTLCLRIYTPSPPNRTIFAGVYSRIAFWLPSRP